MNTTNEITKLIKFPPRKNAIYTHAKEQRNHWYQIRTCGIRSLCPTRQTVRADALKSIIDNYQVFQETWDESLNVAKR